MIMLQEGMESAWQRSIHFVNPQGHTLTKLCLVLIVMEQLYSAVFTMLEQCFWREFRKRSNKETGDNASTTYLLISFLQVIFLPGKKQNKTCKHREDMQTLHRKAPASALWGVWRATSWPLSHPRGYYFRLKYQGHSQTAKQPFKPSMVN